MRHELKDLARDIGKLLYRFFSHRILWLLVVTAVLFYILLAQLFELQIAMADSFRPPAPRTNQVQRPIPAPRGTIYDRHGRPLAINVPSFVVKMDPSVAISNEALLELALLFERNGERYIDEFPISREEPFEFIITGFSPENIAWQEFRFKDDMAVPNPREATAGETWEFLREQFNIAPELSNEDARRIMNFRAPIFQQRLLDWSTYTPTPILFAYDISHATMAAIEERNALFTGLYIDLQTRREYPGGRYVSHMLGYLRQITAAQLAANEHLGYTAHDLFGRTGLELSMERFLRGTPGIQTFEVDSAGRRISAPVWETPPRPGDRIFLTIDLALQQAAFHALEEALSETLIRRLNLPLAHSDAATLEAAFISFTRGHNLDIRRVLESEPDCLAFPMRQYILARFPDASGHRDDTDRIQSIIMQGIEARRISPAKMLLTLIGTGQVTDPDGAFAENLTARPNAAREIVIQKIRERELTPQMFNLDPSTGSVVITCVHTGEVLAAATYPSFDNNRLVNVFDNDYFRHINALCPTAPMRNRPFSEAIAPGSTFKMFTAVAALETGVIGPNTRIFDGISFTSAGHPPVHCWHRGGGHGSINVSTALAVSCNYFFAESAFRLGRGLAGIQTLNEYMAFFGLNESTGVEVGDWNLELYRAGYGGDTMASPEFKRHRVLMFNPFASPGDLAWRDGDTSQVSIGQGFNAYTAAQMTRAMSVIANRGLNLPQTLIHQIENYRGDTVTRHVPVPAESDIEVSDGTWDIVIEGMRLVTQPGAGGTATGVFRNFPVAVAGKTGTAEQVDVRFSHTAFGGFAPLDDPQIAIYVKIPFSANSAFPQIAANIARDLIGTALGIDAKPEHPRPLNTLRE